MGVAICGSPRVPSYSVAGSRFVRRALRRSSSHRTRLLQSPHQWKPPFEEVLPTAAIEKLVRADLSKEQVLKSVYNTRITDSEVEAEVKRMDLTSRAPEILAELKKLSKTTRTALLARSLGRSSSSASCGSASIMIAAFMPKLDGEPRCYAMKFSPFARPMRQFRRCLKS